MEDNYLAKWLNNELSEEELAVFKKTDEYASYVKILKASDNLVAPEYDMEQALEDLRNKRTSKVIKMNPVRRLMQVAAVVALLLAGTYFYINSLGETVATQYAENKEVVLPDASEVILNADSEISYNDKGWDEKRNVSLEGEAFFRVAKGKKFTVTTDLGEIQVLGTQFNVEQRKNYFEVSCFEGLVSVSYKDQEIKLPAGTSFLVINNKIINAESPTTAEPSWMHNESSFKSIPLTYVLDELQRQYNLEVNTKGIDINLLFTGSFSNTDLDVALRSISASSKIKFKLEENKVLFYAENAP